MITSQPYLDYFHNVYSEMKMIIRLWMLHAKWNCYLFCLVCYPPRRESAWYTLMWLMEIDRPLLYKEHMYTKECGRKQKQTEITPTCYDHAASTVSKSLFQSALSWNVLNVNRAGLRVYRRLKKNHNHGHTDSKIKSWAEVVRFSTSERQQQSRHHFHITRSFRLPCANSVYPDAPPPFLTLVLGTRLGNECFATTCAPRHTAAHCMVVKCSAWWMPGLNRSLRFSRSHRRSPLEQDQV